MELRWRALGFVKVGESWIAVAQRSGNSSSRVVKWQRRNAATSSLDAGKRGSQVKPRTSGERRDWLPQQVAAGGQMTLKGLADGQAVGALKVDDRTVRNFVHREGMNSCGSGLWRSTESTRRCPQTGEEPQVPGPDRSRAWPSSTRPGSRRTGSLVRLEAARHTTRRARAA